MRERSEELAGYITLEMGKLIAQSRFEVELSAAILLTMPKMANNSQLLAMFLKHLAA